MKVFFDTSVLVAALLKPHPRHSSAIDWLKRAIAGDIEFFASTHSLAELYSTLSTFPVRPRISPSIAWQLIQENVARQSNSFLSRLPNIRQPWSASLRWDSQVESFTTP